MKFYIINLGCKVNLVEVNFIANELISKKYIKVDDINNADIVIINTCCVTNVAEAKSRNKINFAAKGKKQPIIVIMGCFSQINENYFINNVGDIVVGSKYKASIPKLIDQYLENRQKIILVDNIMHEKTYEEFNVLSSKDTDKTRAFIKIQDGCDFFCSYCIIPYARGRQRSLPIESVINQIENEVKLGVKEIVITGVNTAGYQYNDINFYELMKAITNLPNDFRVRISSIEPFQINEDIIKLLTENKNRWCQHFHLCLQSCSDDVLKKMNRKYT